ncbi:MAG: archaetidylserine decarboxylase [Sandaracinaceae bacterium]|nr:archaetidylserine decarboxylase [Sandaracinaceae bacterium]
MSAIRKLRILLSHLASSKIPHWLLDKLISSFVHFYGVDLSEAEIPPNGFCTFNSFFARALRPGARRFPEKAWLIPSPAEGRLLAEGSITNGTHIHVKGESYPINELLGADSAPLVGGRFSVIYLAPPDYHRVHSPIDGKVRFARWVNGAIFPVNAIGQKIPRIYARNERIVVWQEGEGGEVAVTVLVGAMVVGGIELAFDKEFRQQTLVAALNHQRVFERQYHGIRLSKGSEIGRFMIGSTVILLVKSTHELLPVASVSQRIQLGEVLYCSQKGEMMQ